MTFADIPDFEQGDFKRTEFVKLVSGTTVRLRILDKKAHQVEKHFIPHQRISIMCLGDDLCPVCNNNRKLMAENPDSSPSKIKGFITRQRRYLVNVLNRTQVKETPSGKVVYPRGNDFPPNDPDTGELLVNIEPTSVDRVMVLERGPTLFSQLNAVNDSVVDDAGNPLGLWNFDIGIHTIGSGRKMVTNVTAYSHFNDVPEVDEEDLYDLETVGIKLAPNEVEKVLGGVSLRDVFAERNASEDDALEKDIAKVSQEVSQDVKDSVSDLFTA